MARNKMLTGVAVGALAGALVSLFDKTTREDTTKCLKQMGTHTQGYIDNPSQAFHDLRSQYERATSTIDNSTKQAVSFLNKMEGYLNKLEEKDESPNQLEQ
ncbi:YtxH domain-containing protein [Pontibacillus salicampi]|uniref:YtxH domain-containing protein n=1 Tax=Pontibacillus salicampi TaxID=1449801 RepID=A0ABV6LIF6_9BACI